MTRVWEDCKYKEFVTAGISRGKWLKFEQTIRNLSSGHLGIPLVVSRLRATGLKKTRTVYLLDLFKVWRENGQCNLVAVLFIRSECGFGSLGSWSYSKEWVWNLGAKNVLKLNVSRMTFQSRNLISDIDSCWIAMFTANFCH